MQKIYDVNYLPSDFKKNNGYKRSIEMCKEYNIYRQCYCGCIFGVVMQKK
ncbi:MAG: epoxyqueuosine reductase QueH, partial [Lactobacillales bacterium]|jgi:predicted adenine nucleotide alpha hydrolase (AANH) superfamily ATPase|nr:epoxyqueuosine reductase QueH [Lactobacillales bacterium]